MNAAPTRVLLIEDNAADAKIVQEALANVSGHPFRVESVIDLAAALERLGREKFAVILLSLGLPEGQGLEVFEQVFQAAPDSLVLLSVRQTTRVLPVRPCSAGPMII